MCRHNWGLCGPNDEHLYGFVCCSLFEFFVLDLSIARSASESKVQIL